MSRRRQLASWLWPAGAALGGIALIAGTVGGAPQADRRPAKPTATSAACCTVCAADLLVRARARLAASPGDEVARELFVDAFPNSFAQYMRLFGYESEADHGPIYSAVGEYVDLLASLAADRDSAAGDSARSLLVRLGSEGEFGADAPAALSNALLHLAATNALGFFDAQDGLDARAIRRLARFIAAPIATCDDPEFWRAVDALKNLPGQAGFAEQLIRVAGHGEPCQPVPH